MLVFPNKSSTKKVSAGMRAACNVLVSCKAQKRTLHTGNPRPQSDSKNTNYRIMGFLRECRVIYETENLHVITFWNPNGMSVNETKNENGWESEFYLKEGCN